MPGALEGRADGWPLENRIDVVALELIRVTNSRKHQDLGEFDRAGEKE